ncbi:MAG: ASCH domain-containing protein [Candidatus Pacearchaeota archaeon]
MKVLTLKQPWAELILQGKKKIELRKWNTNFRGPFMIHSSKVPDIKNMKKFGFQNLLNGFVVGQANLINVKKYDSEEEFNNDRDKHLTTKNWGGYGFVLENAERVKPILAKGQLNFWEFKGEIK